jgi:mercuric ion transport protein
MMQSTVESAPLTASGNTGNANAAKSGTLAVAGISGAFASVCCIGPLVLVSIGLGGAAAGVVAAFEPLRPVFIVIAFAALASAGWKIYRRPVAACASGIACIAPQRDQIYRTVFWVVAAAVIALLAVPYYLPLFY